MNAKYTLVLGLHLLSISLLLKIINFVFPSFMVFMCMFLHLSYISTFFLWICIAVITFKYAKEKFLNGRIKTENRAVLITGCDSGFGNALAKRLDSKGFHVFATCLFPDGDGASKLKEACSNRLQVLHADVTKDESVQKAVEYVKGNLGSSELWAIVNNAGIIKGFSVDFSTVDDFKDCLDVNFLGTVRVTKAFLPLLKQTKGRIVNITSAVGELSFPFATPYLTSKYAAVGFTDCLRHEINRFGVSVVSIEPEIFHTGLTSPEAINKHMDTKLESLDRSLKDSYSEDYEASFKDITNVVLSLACPDIRIVVDDLESAVSLLHPDHTYKPRRNALASFICFCYERMPRSCQILIVKFVLFVFFSESKILRKIGKKALSRS